MNDGFDKNNFKKSMNLWKISCVCIALLGVASVALSFFLGNGWGFSPSVDEEAQYQEVLNELNGMNASEEEAPTEEEKDLCEDPKDYYGTYYRAANYVIEKIEIDSSGLRITTHEAISGTQETQYRYAFLCEHEANKNYKQTQDGLVLYEENSSAIVNLIWFEKDGNGAYALRANNGTQYLTQEITWKDLVNDPQNYYGTYSYTANNSVTIDSDGSAIFVLNGVAKTYQYFYANQEWLSSFVGKTYEKAIILHQGKKDELHIFKMEEDGTLIYGDAYSFVKN